MEIDRNKLAALANLDDAAFGNIIYSVILASGGSESAARSAMSSAPIIKAKLKNASDKELRQIIGFIGEKNAADILGRLGK
ncbi:MAG: hypothetical protein E7675_01635 [Ruminococcaceae bacterium]|nr:hypothetical protein [Oscillospiraceae bacterium]